MWISGCSGSASSGGGGGGGTPSNLLFVSNNASSSIYGFTVDASGNLTAISSSPFANGGSAPFWMSYANGILYANNSSPTSLIAHNVPSDGKLTSAGSLPTGRSVAIQAIPDGSAVVLADITSAQVETFHVTNNVLGPFGSPVGTGTNPSSVAVTPDGKNVYVIDNASSAIWAYTYSSSTGSLTANGVPMTITPPAGVTTVGAHRATIDANGKYLFVDSACGYVFVFSIGANGALTPVGSTQVAANQLLGGIAVDKTVTYLYVTDMDNSAGQIYGFTIGAGGSLTPIAGLPLKTGTNTTASPLGIVIDTNGKYLYVANRNEGTIAGFTIGAGGALTAMTTATTAVGTTPIDIVLIQ